MNDEFTRKLLASPAVLSLNSEQRAAATLQKLGWSCFQGAFYRDAKEEKLREADILARQIWTGSRTWKRAVVRLHLVIECKSARDWQVVFASSSDTANEETGDSVWSGRVDEGRYNWLRDAGRTRGAPEAAIPDLIARFYSSAFPGDRPLLYRLMPPVPHSTVVATAFREANLDKEKDLEASVLWRAMSALRSATASLRAEAIAWHAEIFEVSDPRRPFSWVTFQDEFVGSCSESLRHIDIFHPVVLIDAPLWLLRSGRLRQTTICRFNQINSTGSVSWWCDVVNSSGFDSFARETSAYYKAFFRKQGAKQHR